MLEIYEQILLSAYEEMIPLVMLRIFLNIYVCVYIYIYSLQTLIIEPKKNDSHCSLLQKKTLKSPAFLHNSISSCIYVCFHKTRFCWNLRVRNRW
jgi:hypothetical protein